MRIGNCSTLPTSLFNDYAPKLTHLAIDSRALLPAGQYPALQHLTLLDLLHVIPGVVLSLDWLACLLRQYPGLKTLRGVTSTPVDDPSASRGIENHLMCLSLLDRARSEPGCSLSGPLALLQHQRIKRITVWNPTAETFGALVAGLEAKRYVALDLDDCCLEVVDERGFERTSKGCKLEEVFPLVASLPAIKNLELSGTVSHFGGVPPILEAVETMTILIDGAPQRLLLLRCPRIRLLRFEAEDPVPVTATELASFVRSVLGHTTQTLAELQLHNMRVEWTDGSSQLESLVQRIVATEES